MWSISYKARGNGDQGGRGGVGGLRCGEGGEGSTDRWTEPDKLSQ